MKQFNSILAGCLLVTLAACSTSGPGIFRKQSLHEQYGQKIDAAGLKQTALGTQWFAAAARALQQPVVISIPHRETGYFAAEKPSAVGLRFTAQRGQKILLQLDKKTSAALTLYLEIWKMNQASPSLLQSFDTTQSKHEFEVDDNADYLLRLQPELLGSCEYTLSISVGPSLQFPVAGTAARIGSIWGDARDAGARQHEGIDIFAAKRTPAIAAAEGTVTRVNESNLGGRVVWLRPAGRNYTLYYAHLDEQLVSSGQKVRSGDTIGLVGNTGNARSTPPHLHFGVYSLGGAIDPLPFVQPGIKKPAAINDDAAFDRPVRITAAIKSNGTTYRQNTVAFPLAITPSGYRVVLPDETVLQLERNQQSQTSWRKTSLKITSFLYERPDSTAPRKVQLPENAELTLYGSYEGFAYAANGNSTGWVLLKDTR